VGGTPAAVEVVPGYIFERRGDRYPDGAMIKGQRPCVLESSLRKGFVEEPSSPRRHRVVVQDSTVLGEGESSAVAIIAV
jgi:hypothetical protein